MKNENLININVTIKREKAKSVQQSISEPEINGNNITVTCYDNQSDDDVLVAVMYAIDDSELIDNIYNTGHKDINLNGKKWSLSNCEFR